MDIKNLFHDRRQVGRTVKASKVYYVWEFVLTGKITKLELFHSVFSAKKKLVLNNKLLYDDESYGNDFSYSFSIHNHSLKLIQKSSDKFELNINGRPFKLLMDDEISKTYSIVKKDDDKAVDDLCGNFDQIKERNSDKRNSIKRTSIRQEIPNFFDDNDFDFGDGFEVHKQQSSSNKNNAHINSNNVQNKNVDKVESNIVVEEPSSNIDFFENEFSNYNNKVNSKSNNINLDFDPFNTDYISIKDDKQSNNNENKEADDLFDFSKSEMNNTMNNNFKGLNTNINFTNNNINTNTNPYSINNIAYNNNMNNINNVPYNNMNMPMNNMNIGVNNMMYNQQFNQYGQNNNMQMNMNMNNNINNNVYNPNMMYMRQNLQSNANNINDLSFLYSINNKKPNQQQ